MNIRLKILAVAVVPVLLSSCERPQAQFVSSERTTGLMRTASRSVEATLLESFGTPQDLVAWLRFPVEYGGFPGKVTASDGTESDLVQSMAVEFGTEVSVSLEGLELQWTQGKYVGNKLTVTAYSPETQTLTFRQKLQEPPNAGDEFVVSPGHNLSEGRRLYMTHCMHCHGVSGDGDGPTARYLNPRPRDYRLGIFKFTSTAQPEKINRGDFKRIVKLGIPGTYMPSFMLLKDDELTTIIEYVRWLSMRGEYEKKLVDELEGDYSREAYRQRLEDGETKEEINTALDEYLEGEYPEASDIAASDLAESWVTAEKEESIVVPSVKRTVADKASIARGRKLYLSKKAKCVTCHGPTGRGDGPQTEAYMKIPGTNDEFPEPGLFDAWNNRIKPRNLTRGIYRGGRRPVDLFRRIYASIKGTPMPAFGKTVLKDNEIWDLVNYVMSVPYQAEGSHPAGKKEDVAGETRTPNGS